MPDPWTQIKVYAVKMKTSDFTSFSTVFVISGQWIDDNEWLCAIKPPLCLRRFHL